MDILIAVVVTAIIVAVACLLIIRNNKDKFDKALADANAKAAYLESVVDNLKK